jgi:hypothetical protein
MGNRLPHGLGGSGHRPQWYGQAGDWSTTRVGREHSRLRYFSSISTTCRSTAPSLGMCASPWNRPNRGVLERVPVPLRIRALHGQKVGLFALEDETHRNRDRPSRLPADHADLDLAAAGEVIFEISLLRGWHLAPENRERDKSRSHTDHGTDRN